MIMIINYSHYNYLYIYKTWFNQRYRGYISAYVFFHYGCPTFFHLACVEPRTAVTCAVLVKCCGSQDGKAEDGEWHGEWRCICWILVSNFGVYLGEFYDSTVYGMRIIIYYYIIIYYHILSYIIIYYHILSYIIIYYHIWSYIFIYFHILSYVYDVFPNRKIQGWNG